MEYSEVTREGIINACYNVNESQNNSAWWKKPGQKEKVYLHIFLEKQTNLQW